MIGGVTMRYSRDFTITQRDTERFYQTLVLRRWSKGILGFAVVGALVLKLYMDWLGFSLGTAGTVAAMVLGGILTAVFITAGVLWRTKRNVAKLMRKRGRESYVQQTKIDGFGVHVTVDGESAKVGFDKLVRVQETRDAFYLFITDTEAWLLPKAQMDNVDEECRTIREIFSKVVAPMRLKLQEK